MSLEKKLKNLRFICIFFLTGFSLMFGLSCNRSLVSKGADSNAAVVSIGKLPEEYAKCRLEIDISVDGVVSAFTGNANLVKKVYKVGQKAIVGAKSTGKCNNKTLYTEKDSSSRCPYVTRILSSGVNHVTMKFCMRGESGNLETIPESDPDTDPDTNPDPDPEKDKDKQDIEIITTIEDNDLDLPPEVNIQIQPTINHQ